MSKRYEISIDVTVHDEKALFDHAMSIAMQGGNSEEEALSMLKPEGEIDASACITMVLDPGESPPGLTIEQSSVESY
ncbi:hypothetical protein SB778_03830 [Paraburkholderia sp. SIMBA_050]